MAIINFSNQTFKLVEVPDLKVKDLMQLAKENQPRLFVVHDPKHKASALVIPELVRKVVEKANLAPSQLATDGLIAVLRRRQITVKGDQPAETVAKLASMSHAEFVIVVNNQRAPSGLFIPNVVAKNLPHARMVQEMPGLQREVELHIASDNLTGAINKIEKIIKDFHSERINLDVPDPYICEGDEEDGAHTWNSCPCPYHPSAACGKREVLTRP
ncbi:MAG TPA: hypothetical protein VGW58_06755 [Pyrinomonadaceae bacterium]|nr:hypothetical protein [Pyrinomonadaceae bacterium]